MENGNEKDTTASEDLAVIERPEGREELGRGARRKKGWDEEPTETAAITDFEGAKKEIEALRKQIQQRTEANAEIAMQARMQLQQEQELHQLATMAVVRRDSVEISRGMA